MKLFTTHGRCLGTSREQNGEERTVRSGRVPLPSGGRGGSAPLWARGWTATLRGGGEGVAGLRGAAQPPHEASSLFSTHPRSPARPRGLGPTQAGSMPMATHSHRRHQAPHHLQWAQPRWWSPSLPTGLGRAPTSSGQCLSQVTSPQSRVCPWSQLHVLRSRLRI